MYKNKILIYGSKGWIGNQFIQILKNNNVDYMNGNVRVDNYKMLVKEINDINPTHIISFIGRTHGIINDVTYSTIDYLEQKGKLTDNLRDNLFAPLTLAQICTDKKIHYTYLGTGCIFKFDEDHPFGEEVNGFTEEHLPNFFGSGYSIAKGFTDRLMHTYNNSVLNLRIRMPITENKNPRNFITKITTYEKICSISNSMTVLPDMLPIILDMMQKKVTGTINLTNPGLISHNEILQMYKDIIDNDFVWKNFTTEEQNKILASERSNNFLDTSKLQSLYPYIPNIKDSVKNIMHLYKKSISEQNKFDFENTKDTVLLVTGGCGFIGSNFINYIAKKYDKIKIINLDAMYYCANVDNIDKNVKKSNNYMFVKGNICSSDLVSNLLKIYNCTYVINFAAQSHVQNSFEESLLYTQSNIVGTHTLLECCRLYGKIKKIIHVSTDEVYGQSLLDLDESAKTEQSILCPTNPYAATKAGAELIAQSYIHSYKMPIVITRGNNVYGKNQYPEKLIPKFIKLLNDNEKVTIQGNGENIRGFLHVDDTVTAFETILTYGKTGEIYNIGCDEDMEYSVIDVTKILIKMIKNTEDYDKWITYVEDRPFNDIRYFISNDKIKKLGWKITVDFIDGVKELINTQNY